VGTPASAAVKRGSFFAAFCKKNDAFYGRLEAIVSFFYNYAWNF
jgi:hypothetical protein